VSNKEETRELVVIGAGPGGYPAAFHAADRGMKVTLIDPEANPGGVCLYRGCIPSKALLHVVKVMREAEEASACGLKFAKPEVDLDAVRNWKNSVVKKLTGGLGQLSKQRKIEYIRARATLKDGHSLTYQTEDGDKKNLAFEHAIVATGSLPIRIPNLPESPRIMTSREALDLESFPKSLLVVGGGYIGLELGQVYAALGAEVTVVEMLPDILAGADKDLSVFLKKRLKKQFKDILTNTKVAGMAESDNGITVTFEDKDGNSSEREFDKVMLSVGRKPNARNVGLENTAAVIDEKGFVETDGQLRTAEPTIFAIGDIAGQPMLAHKATAEAKVAVEAINGSKQVFAPAAIPAVVFSDPEVAWAGLTETEAKEAGRDIKVLKFPWAASGRATTLARSDGLTKLIVEPDSGRVLGVGMTGPGAGELIAEGALAIEMGAVTEDIALTIHAHPTLTETMMEAAEAFEGRATHFYGKS
jgi:dihydrolipoamide dehydrogenase